MTADPPRFSPFRNFITMRRPILWTIPRTIFTTELQIILVSKSRKRGGFFPSKHHPFSQNIESTHRIFFLNASDLSKGKNVFIRSNLRCWVNCSESKPHAGRSAKSGLQISSLMSHPKMTNCSQSVR